MVSKTTMPTSPPVLPFHKEVAATLATPIGKKAQQLIADAYKQNSKFASGPNQSQVDKGVALGLSGPSEKVAAAYHSGDKKALGLAMAEASATYDRLVPGKDGDTASFLKAVEKNTGISKDQFAAFEANRST